MMNVFLDTNILIDYLSRREPFFETSALLFQLGKRRKCQLLIASLSFATTSFILQAHYKLTQEAITEVFSKIIKLCNVTIVDAQTVEEAIASHFPDFEDAMQYFSAQRGRADMIITRNKQDFMQSVIPVLEPKEFIDKYS